MQSEIVKDRGHDIFVLTMTRESVKSLFQDISRYSDETKETQKEMIRSGPIGELLDELDWGDCEFEHLSGESARDN